MGKMCLGLVWALFFLQSAAATEPTRFWCNERFLNAEQRPFDARHLKIAKRGYLYVLAAAMALASTRSRRRMASMCLRVQLSSVRTWPRRSTSAKV